jgi:hypothetical protein
MREVCAQGLRGDPITTHLPLPNPTLRKIAKLDFVHFLVGYQRKKQDTVAC